MLSVDGQRAKHTYTCMIWRIRSVTDAGLPLAAAAIRVARMSCLAPGPTCSPSCAGEPLDPKIETPHEWREYVERYAGRSAPTVMTDGITPEYVDWSQGYDPGSWLDRCIVATRREVFPYHGLDPEY